MRDPRIEQTPVDKLLDEIQRLRDENEKLWSRNRDLAETLANVELALSTIISEISKVVDK